eukprot:23510_1
MSTDGTVSNTPCKASLPVCGLTLGFIGFIGYKAWKSYGFHKDDYSNQMHDPSLKSKLSKINTITYIPLKDLHDFETKMFMFCGVPQSDAIAAANVLCSADSRGIDSHGVARLQTYFEKLVHKIINPSPNIKIIRETETTATIDGDGGLGLVIGSRANEVAIQKAIKYGSGWVAVCNSNHYGIAGYYAMKALDKGCIGLSMTNTSPVVTPTFGLQRMLGTNPIAMAFPGNKDEPIVVDMATSTVTFGKIEEARRKREQIPNGWAIDTQGNPIHNPDDVIYNGGLQLPLGSTEQGQSHKGYCLSTMVDILCGVLSGANYGPHVESFAISEIMKETKESRGVGRGHFFGALRIDGFRDLDTFTEHIDKFRQDLHGCKSLPNKKVLVPGDPESAQEKIRMNTGIPVKYDVVCDLLQIAKHCNIDLPKALQ